MKLKLKVFLYLFLIAPQPILALQSTATLTLVGFVRPVTTIATVDYRQNLVLDTTSSPQFQKIGQISIKMNTDIDGIYVQSGSRTVHPGPITIQVNESCTSLKTTSEGVILDPSAQNMKTANSIQIAQSGIQETCDLLASWRADQKPADSRHTGAVPVYPVHVIVSLVSL